MREGEGTATARGAEAVAAAALEALREPFLVFGMLVRPADPEDAQAVESLAPLPAAPRAGPAPSRREAAAHLIREGTLRIVEDDWREPMGLVRLRRGAEGIDVGWSLAPARLGKGLGAILAEGLTERAISVGAPGIGVRLPPSARQARKVLEGLGYVCPAPAGRPLALSLDRDAFAARPLRGTGLLPSPAQRRRGPSEGEQAVIAWPDDLTPEAMAGSRLRGAFPAPVADGDLVLRLAAPRDAEALAALLAPAAGEPVRPGGDTLLLALREGEPVGVLRAAAMDDGGIDLGWFVAPRHRGEGIGARIAAAAAGRLFAGGAPRLSCRPEGCPRSASIATRLGFAPGPSGMSGTAAGFLAARESAGRHGFGAPVP